MAQILYSATDPKGHEVQGFVDAATTAQAREQLVARGFANVVLHQEAALSTDPSVIEGLSPRQLQEFARISIAAMRKPGVLPLLGDVLRLNRAWLAFDVLLLGWGLYSGSRWMTVTAGVLLALPFALAIWNYRHGGRYVAMIKAYSVGDWAQVRDLCAKLRIATQRSPQMDFDLDVRLACIEAHHGRGAAALAGLESWRAKLAGSPGVFEGRAASVALAGGDRQGFVDWMEQAYRCSPGEPSRAIDLALAHARFGDAARAAEFLRAADASLLPPHAHGFVYWVDGIVKLRTGEAGGLDVLGRAVAEFLKLSSQPAVWTSLAFCACDHAVALSLAGARDAARAELAKVWPMILAHADKPLLRMLEADGLTPS